MEVCLPGSQERGDHWPPGGEEASGRTDPPAHPQVGALGAFGSGTKMSIQGFKLPLNVKRMYRDQSSSNMANAGVQMMTEGWVGPRESHSDVGLATMSKKDVPGGLPDGGTWSLGGAQMRRTGLRDLGLPTL